MQQAISGASADTNKLIKIKPYYKMNDNYISISRGLATAFDQGRFRSFSFCHNYVTNRINQFKASVGSTNAKLLKKTSFLDRIRTHRAL